MTVVLNYRHAMAVAAFVMIALALPDTGSAQFLRERQRDRESTQTPTTASLTSQPKPRTAARPASNKSGGPGSQVKAALATEKIPRDALTRYEGRWKGSFWVYGPAGGLVERKTVQVDCAMTPDGQMTMTTHMFDMVGRKLVVVEVSTYQITGPDTIRVAIQRPTGKIETQNGRWNDDALFLTSSRSDGMEHFRERISDGKLLVDGYGIYGGAKDLSKHSVFVGRLKRDR